ncbi:transcription elongation factor GreA [Borreliella afzelii]|uniref:Transcription elongation factor GreA n=2 Tax=Borreliella afzelii TaxID=29518 RepID=Q0SP31_BORAP|nr:transcription elongation factor GreA [Borreliella afzelii]ABH01397.1 transcription elongation factor [Borreliella afzelii PKo]AEL69363.1 transcription elongation factor GreA domain protein [Borreliella afzelii PKo]AJY72130.1 transcription elongation factor GreA domain protein [Borreliella afzelii K78]EEC20789.1 transcription elongation factor GreA (Transcript cleavage factor greA) [Borreliella afzelii ACA-1]
MSNVTIEKLDSILQEDKWTRIVVNNYSLAKIKELDDLIDNIIDEGLTEDVLDICGRHLKDVKKSIAGLYISGMLIYSRRPLNDMNLLAVIDLFSQNLKWALVEHICNEMLSISENKHALYTLAKIYAQNNENDKLPNIWTRIVEADIDDTVFVRQLATYYETIDLQKSIFYFRKAIYRFIDKKQMSGIREVWAKLIHYVSDDFDSFLLILQKIEKDLGFKKAIVLYEDLFDHYSLTDNIDETIEILKGILKLDNKNHKARENLVKFLRERYKDVKNIEDYLVKSDIENLDKNFVDVYSDFEKYLFFAKGNFVYHQTWSVGIVRDVNDHGITVDFVSKRGHFIGFDMAMSALSPLSREDIRVLKAITPKEELADRVKKDIEWAIKVIIKSYKAIDLKGIKKELVPSLMTQSSWNSWSLKAKQILKDNPHFVMDSGKLDCYVYNERSSNLNEKMYDKFKIEKDFYKRYEIFINYCNVKGIVKDLHIEEEMLNYFLIYVNNFTKVDHHVISSYVILKSLGNFSEELSSKVNIEKDVNLEFLLKEYSKGIVDLFDSILNAEIKKELVVLIKRELSNWILYYKELFPHSVNKKLVESLYKEDPKEVEKLFNYVIKNYKIYKDAYIWILKHFKTYSIELSYSDSDLLANLIKILTDSVIKINNKNNSVASKRIYKMVINLLVKDGYLKSVLEYVRDEELAKRVYMTCFYVKDFPPKDLLDIKSIIRQLFDSVEFEDEKMQLAGERMEIGFLTILSSLNKKQKELKHLKEVEIPENSKEIGKARELGDLKENAEYHSAKEKQQFLTKRLNSLMLEIENAKVIDTKDLQSSVVGFGTKVIILNEVTGKDESYLILGPWESNPDEGIISYKSPFGENLLDSREGDSLNFIINNTNFKYFVKKIEPIKFS